MAGVRKFVKRTAVRYGRRTGSSLLYAKIKECFGRTVLIFSKIV
jgi:hypothetical protein